MQLGVHAALEVDVVLPGLDGIARVLVPFADNLVEMAERNLGHQGLLDGAAKEGLDAGVAAHFLAGVVQDGHYGILFPPFGVLDTVHLAAHHNDLTGGDELAAAIGRPKVGGHARDGDVTVECLGKPRDHLVPLTGAEGGWRSRGEHKVTIQINNQSLFHQSAGGGGGRRSSAEKLTSLGAVNKLRHSAVKPRM